MSEKLEKEFNDYVMEALFGIANKYMDTFPADEWHDGLVSMAIVLSKLGYMECTYKLKDDTAPFKGFDAWDKELFEKWKAGRGEQ